MQLRQLGKSDLKVSEICLGSMTWGRQNNQQDADLQIEYALAEGVNFIDTAELYAVPPNPNSYGATEKIIGNWLQRNPAKRESIIIATKIAGPNVPWIRDGGLITADCIKLAVEKSLTRLETDYIDLYQLHWPNYANFHFGKQWPFAISHDANSEQLKNDIGEIQLALTHLVNSGKIRHYGLSNESPWGLHCYLEHAHKNNLPGPISIQNEFSLLMLKDVHYLLECCIKENIGYLPWSPLGGGVLSGKYMHGIPEGSRWSIAEFQPFRNMQSTHDAVTEYMQVADKHNISLAQLSLAFCLHTAGITSTIIGATTQQQLIENISAKSVTWTEALQNDIVEVIKRHPQPF